MSNICFIGGGNMATSLIGGLIAQGHAANSISVSDPNEAQREQLTTQYGINTFADCAPALADADIVVLAVKPQVMKDVALIVAKAAEQSSKQPLFVSIAAGINLYSLQQWLGKDQAIVRCMPNTPSLIQLGATGLFANEQTSIVQKNLAETVLKAAGIVQWVQSEAEIDAVTAVSGSGPAYYFLLMEAMIDAGIELGLSRETASELTIQTAIGAAQMAKESDVDVAELRRRVTSPGGTTEEAINTFEGAHLRDIVKAALSAANRRSGELALMLGEEMPSEK
ncbi:MAG: pyrroline-5-carboxylate reductase [Oleispira sp.]|jgi:pyrroline-5-carboxylate reductase|tara:strand:+ start:1364 stop:2206 length:843 start_codon:yes stop_codon:yes gene_type:complete